ncbi:hypothetical protein A2592_01135 [Candidatus Kaiserbacteria bacterium RIFOXYD1_FULL_42_15]|uniref:Magnesium transporter CorA n=1 Tax=Candidatus Kaiserbacteria bacterium RIFOXYD1_FULL_42_15 TaxID=1798532 RepID=A0A1F6FT43_9BACT|nr:MAG: hypothetical protein A2592_01135 [Candidatus Kaiserbacteria bacterium RIFOXYD1_FULL_42_15]
MITYYFRTIKDTELKTVTESRTGVWVHALAPTKEEIESLVAQFALDEDIIEDAQDFFEVPRLERSAGATYFFTRYPFEGQKEESDTAPLLIIMGESFVITLALRDVPPLQKLIENKEEVVTTQKAKLFIQIMDAITYSFDGELMRLRKAVHKNRSSLRKIGTSEIERLVQYETKLNSMVDALIPTNDWLRHVPKGNYMQLYNDDLEMMEDLEIANGQLVNSARSVLKTIQNIRSGVEAIMGSRLNNSLRVLTVLTILLMVPQVISSLYGMNVDLPLQNSPWAFSFIAGANILVLAVLVVVFRKKNWF